MYSNLIFITLVDKGEVGSHFNILYPRYILGHDFFFFVVVEDSFISKSSAMQ